MNEIIAWLAHPGLAQALLFLAILATGVRNLPQLQGGGARKAAEPSDPTS